MTRFPPDRLWRLAAILSVGVMLTAATVNLTHPFAMDFASYWAAGRMAASGDPAGAYDIARHHAVEAGAVPAMTMMPFPYPPPFLLVLAPFGIPGFSIAAAIWIAATLLIYGAIVARLTPGVVAAALAFPPAMLCGVIGQNAFLTTGLLLVGVGLAGRRPWLAGMMIAALAIKPQLGILTPLALLAGREWRTIGAAALGVALLVLVSVVAFGLEPWRGFFALMPLYGRIAADGLVGYGKMASLFSALRLLGIAEGIAWAAHGAAAIGGAVLVWRCWRRTTDPLARSAALAIGTALGSPYFYIYDQLILVAALAWLKRDGAPNWLLSMLYVIPLVGIAQMAAGREWFNPAPLLPLALLALGWRRLGAPAGDQAGTLAGCGAACRTPSSTWSAN